MICIQTQTVTNGDMSANISSRALDVNNSWLDYIQCVFTGSPVGSMKVQISGDTTYDPAAVVNWNDYSGSTSAINGAGIIGYECLDASYRWIRVVYTATSGSGTLNVIHTTKGL